MMGITIDFQLSSRGNFNPIYLLARKNLTARILALLDLVGKVYSKYIPPSEGVERTTKTQRTQRLIDPM